MEFLKSPELYIVKFACPNCANGNCQACVEDLLRKKGKMITGERFHCACYGNDHSEKADKDQID